MTFDLKSQSSQDQLGVLPQSLSPGCQREREKRKRKSGREGGTEEWREGERRVRG
jgi:hypothetical protein